MLIFAIAPALILIVYGDRLADRLLPEASPEPTWNASSALVVGCMLLSLFFMVEGGSSLIAGLVVGVASLFRDTKTVGFYDFGPLEQVSWGTAQLMLGFLIYRYASTRASESGLR